MASEEQQRATGGGYTDAEFEAAMLRSQRSDPLTVAIKVATLAVVYVLLFRAVAKFQLPVSLLWLPLAAEFLAIMWIGRFVIRPFVDCNAFMQSMGGWSAFVFWNVVVVGAYVAAFAWDSQQGGFAGVFAERWRMVRESGMHFAIGAAVVGLLLSTIVEVVRWRAQRGVFVWTSIMASGFRMGVMLLAVFAAVFVGIFLGQFLGDDADTWPWSWIVFGFLLFVDFATLVATTMFHRELLQKQHGSKHPNVVIGAQAGLQRLP